MKKPNYINFLIPLIALILSLAVVSQFRAVREASMLISRDSRSNVFQEIRVLLERNKDLAIEVNELEQNLARLSDQNQALSVIEDEIGKYKLLSGNYPVFGEGIKVTIQDAISNQWLLDLTNDLFVAGAEAVSINGIRVSNKTAGFDLLPNGQVFFGGASISYPLYFEAIGDASVMNELMIVTGGSIDRLKSAYPYSQVSVDIVSVIKMD